MGNHLGSNPMVIKLSLADIQEPPTRRLIMLTGTPGAGKSTFCYQMVLNSIAEGRPVIFVSTEESTSDIMRTLRDRGLSETHADLLNFVDAFAETVGLETPVRPNIMGANCEDLNSINMAIAKLQQNIGRENIHLFFDSLTSPYLFNREEIFRFIKLSLSKFAAEGNSVVALIDEGCGRKEDLVAMMSIADGIIRIEMKENSKIINVVKHPSVAPARIETPLTLKLRREFNIRVARHLDEVDFKLQSGQTLRTEVGDFVNIFWRNLASWSGMFWDPKRFPKMAYELVKEHESQGINWMFEFSPWHKRLSYKFLPKNFSEVKDMKKVLSELPEMGKQLGVGFGEYAEKASKKNEHYFRIYENSSSWGFDNIGARLCFHNCGGFAGFLTGMEKEGRDWNVVETECIGMGAPYCEFKAVPGENDNLKDYLESIDSSIVEKIQKRLMDQLTGFLIDDKPLPERPRLGSGISFHDVHHVTSLPASFSERYRMALRMGGAKTGKEIGEHLMEIGSKEDEVLKQVINFMDYCKVGKIALGDTIRIRENCESFGLESSEPFCFFTTGFLNGVFSTVKSQHVKETRCIAVGDPFCEWEFI